MRTEAVQVRGVDPQTAPQWNDKQEKAPSLVTFTVLPVGWVGEWHENPRPQWITILSGRWFVETMDGTRVEMGPGELMMGEDQGTRERDGKKGHLSGTVGDEPCAMIVTGLDVTPTINQPVALSKPRAMDRYELIQPRFKKLVLPNAYLETLAEGFAGPRGRFGSGIETSFFSRTCRTTG